MSDWNIYPWNVSGILIAFVLLVFAIYLSTIRRKSAVTWTLVILLFTLVAGMALANLGVIANNSGWTTWILQPGVIRPLESLIGFSSTVLFIILLYLIGPVRFRKEQRIVVGLLIVIGVLYTVDRLFWHTDAEPPYVGPISALMLVWSVVLIGRKWLRAGSAPDGARAMYGALLGLVGIWSAMSLVGFGLDRMGAIQTLEIVNEVMTAAIPIFLGLVFLQFVPEATSLEAKFVAGGFLAVMVLAQLETAPVNSNHELRYRYAPNLEPQTITLIPTDDSGYRAEGRPYMFLPPSGDTLGTADDFTTALKVRFPVVVYGQERDSVYVTANGKVHFEPRTDERTGYQQMLNLDVPVVSAFDMDLNPSERGAVLGLSADDSLVVTWNEVPQFHNPDGDAGPFPVDRRIMNAQLIIRRDGTITITRGELPFRPLNWARGISPGRDVMTQNGHAPDSTAWFGQRGTLQSALLPVTASAVEPMYFEERNIRDYQAWSRAETIRLLRNAFIVFFLVLLIIPAYYRFTVRRRLRRLMRGLSDVNDGKLDQDVPVTINDEVGQLSGAFNEMTGSLRQYAHRMEDLVDERTAELRATQSQLIEQEKLASLGSLTAGIAHEIKNPLNFVNNFAEVSRELADELAEAVSAGRTDEAADIIADLKENAAQIAKHGGRADSIVRSMMQHARGGASERETIDVNAFVEEYVDLAWHGMRARDHTFQCEVERALSPDAGTIEGQPQELGRVLLNLMNNAFYALSMEGAANESVVRVKTARSNGRVTITIEDSGPGIPDDIRERIFEPFFTTKPTGEGTGLGLSLSYDIITKGHGGELGVGSSEFGGASFTINLPAGS